MMTTRRGLAVRGLSLLAVTALGACGSLVPAATPPALYVLGGGGGKTLPGPPVPWQLSVEEPAASNALDTDYIALSPAPEQIEYFQGVRWASRLPVMIQILLIEAFEASGRIAAVGRQAVGLRSDYDLSVQIRNFQAIYSDIVKSKPPVVQVRMVVKMIGSISRNITASHTFETTEPATVNDVAAVVAAFNRAVERINRQIVSWALSQPFPKQQ